MLQSEEYQLLSRFVETEKRSNLIDEMVYEIKNLLKTTCDWYSINTVIDKIEKFGVEFGDE